MNKIQFGAKEVNPILSRIGMLTTLFFGLSGQSKHKLYDYNKIRISQSPSLNFAILKFAIMDFAITDFATMDFTILKFVILKFVNTLRQSLSHVTYTSTCSIPQSTKRSSIGY